MAEFDLAKATHCELHKVDIPEVQAIIRLLRAPAARELRRIADEALATLEDRLDELAEDDQGQAVVRPAQESDDENNILVALLLSLLILVRTRVEAPFSARLETLLIRSVDSLLTDGAAAIGLTLPEGPRRALLRRAAISELQTLLRGSALSREGDIRDALETALTSAQARRILTPLESAALLPRTAREPPRSRQEALEDVRLAISGEAVGDGRLPTNPGTVVGATLDSWAYRWYSIGQFESGLSIPGVLFFEASNNPPRGPDGRTTAFCRWVHGKTIPLTRARGQVDRHITLALSEDFQGLVSNWEFIDPITAKRGDEDEFASFFSSVGLPPYHFACRTVLRPVTFGDL